MPRPKVEKHSPRSVGRGLVIRLPNNGPDEVVRRVSVVLHMANGRDMVLGEDEEVSVLVEQPKLIEQDVLEGKIKWNDPKENSND